MDNGNKEIYVISRKGKRKHLLSLLEFLFVEGKAKWPYIRVIQRRNTNENDLGRTQSKISETVWPYNLVVENMGFEIRETRFCIPVSLFNNFTILYSLPDLHKTPIPNTCNGIMYTEQWLFGAAHYESSKYFWHHYYYPSKAFKKLWSSWNKHRKAGITGNGGEVNEIASQNIQKMNRDLNNKRVDEYGGLIWVIDVPEWKIKE